MLYASRCTVKATTWHDEAQVTCDKNIPAYFSAWFYDLCGLRKKDFACRLNTASVFLEHFGAKDIFVRKAKR